MPAESAAVPLTMPVVFPVDMASDELPLGLTDEPEGEIEVEELEGLEGLGLEELGLGLEELGLEAPPDGDVEADNEDFPLALQPPVALIDSKLPLMSP